VNEAGDGRVYDGCAQRGSFPVAPAFTSFAPWLEEAVMIPMPIHPAASRVVRWTTSAVAATVLAACTAAPLSYLNDRQVTQRAMLHRYPVFVVAVDGSSTTFRPVPISPGEHLVTLDAPAVAGFSQPVQKTFPMTIAPCTRYYIAAQRRAALEQDWDLVVEVTYPVGGCDPAREIEKARSASSTIESLPTPLAHAAPR
jgi:hypothetical protein